MKEASQISVQIGNVLAEQQKVEESATVYMEAIELDEENEEAQQLLAELMSASDNDEQTLILTVYYN